MEFNVFSTRIFVAVLGVNKKNIQKNVQRFITITVEQFILIKT